MTTLAAYTAWIRGQVGTDEDPRGSNRQPYAALAGHANGQPWCLTGLVAGAKATGLQLPFDSAYTPAAESAFKRAGALHTDPRPGDFGFLYFSSMGRVAHVFFVLAVQGDVVSTIEFNSNADGSRDGYTVATKRRNYRTRGATYVRSFGRPSYSPTAQEDDVPLTTAEIKAIANETAAVVWGWGLSGWDNPDGNKMPAHERLTAVHEIADRALWRVGNPLTAVRDRVMGVIPEQLSDLVGAIWTRKVAVRHPQTDEAQDLPLDLALGRAASVVSNARGTGVLAGQQVPEPEALAAAIAAAIPTDLADRVVTALTDRLTTRS